MIIALPTLPGMFASLISEVNQPFLNMGPVPEVKTSQFFSIPPGYAGYKPNGTPMDPRQAGSFDEVETMLSLANNHYQAFLQAQVQGVLSKFELAACEADSEVDTCLDRAC